MSGIISAKPFNDVFPETRDNATMQAFVTAIYEVGMSFKTVFNPQARKKERKDLSFRFLTCCFRLSYGGNIYSLLWRLAWTEKIDHVGVYYHDHRRGNSSVCHRRL